MKTKINKKRAKTNLAHILEGHCAETIGRLARNAYKYTDAGVTIGAFVNNEWIYSDELLKVSPRASITALSVSSIVEGVDQETEKHTIDLEAYSEPSAALYAYNVALDTVEFEANQIWQETHGCESCARQFQIQSIPGNTPVWKDCPDCDGTGQVI